MPIMLFLILILIFVVLLVVVTNIVIVPQSMVYVVERLGSYSETWSAGLHVKIPFLERVAKKVSLKEQVADFPPQPVITRDNVTMQIDTVVFFQVMDAKLYTYGVNQPIAAIESLSATTLRNIIGEMELDHTLTSRDTINSKITAILDEAKAKAEGLTETEKKEQALLREEYIASFRKNLRSQLNQIDIQNADGSVENLGEKYGKKVIIE